MDNQKINFQFYFSPSQHSSTLYLEIGRARSDSFSQSPSPIEKCPRTVWLYKRTHTHTHNLV